MKLARYGIPLAVAIVALWAGTGCKRKHVDVDKTLDCAKNQPYKTEALCKTCCAGEYKLSDTVCLCYK